MKKRIYKALIPFWRNISISRIPMTKLWRIEIPKKKGLNYQETKACAYAILDALCSDFSIGCVVTVK